MFRDSSWYSNVIEVSYSGLDGDREMAAAILGLEAELARSGVGLREVERGSVPGQVVITVGPGAELHALRLIDWLVQRMGQAPEAANVYIHPYNFSRPMFFELPHQAAQARQLLLEIAERSTAAASPAPLMTAAAAPAA